MFRANRRIALLLLTILFLLSAAASAQEPGRTPQSVPELRQLKAVFKVVLDKNKLGKIGLKPAQVNAALSNSCILIPTIDDKPILLAGDAAAIVEIKLRQKEITKAMDEAKKILGHLQNIVITSINDQPVWFGDVATIEVDIKLMDREAPKAKEKANALKAAEDSETPPKLIRDANGRPGLRLTEMHVNGLGLKVAAAQTVTKPQSLPPLIGTIHYDTERLFNMRTRTDGEIVAWGQVEEAPDPARPNARPTKRPMRVGDRVKQGALLAVIFSPELGRAKGAFVDAVLSLRLSQDALERVRKLFEAGEPLALLRAAERKVQADTAALTRAERTLYLMKLSRKEVQDLHDEAKNLGDRMRDPKFVRDAKAEAMKWGTFEIRAPQLSDDPKRELTIVEKNACAGAIVEPGKGWSLMRLADTSKLQIWVQPPEEFLPLLRAGMKEKGGLEWEIRMQAEPNAAPIKLPVDRLGPSLEPNQKIAPVVGCLPNKDHKYLVGQFVTATFFVPPPADVVAIPTAAIQEIGGQALVFVQPDPAKNEYVLCRVSIVHRFADVTWVTTLVQKGQPDDGTDPSLFNCVEIDVPLRLTAEKEKDKQSKRPIEPLLTGERVVILGNVELMAALETLLAKEDNGAGK